MYARSEPAVREPEGSARPPLVRELLLVAGLFLVYKLGRQAANGHVEEAFRNAAHVWDVERALRLPGEGSVQGVLLHSETLIHLANTYYAAVHFPATVLFLVWLYWRRPRHYVWSRRILAVLTGAALALHLLFPLAPPRMLAASGLVDTGRVYGPTVYGAAPTTDSLANQFAAMPSLHFGWSMTVAVGLIVATRARWSLLWLLHPLATLLVIVGTANHYWLDAIVVSALLAVAFAALRLPRPAPVRAHIPWPSRETAAVGALPRSTAVTAGARQSAVTAGAYTSAVPSRAYTSAAPDGYAAPGPLPDAGPGPRASAVAVLARLCGAGR